MCIALQKNSSLIINQNQIYSGRTPLELAGVYVTFAIKLIEAGNETESATYDNGSKIKCGGKLLRKILTNL